MATSPVKVTVTGAAGQIGYALLFRIAAGHLLGPDAPVRLSLLEIAPALKAAEGTAMELTTAPFRSFPVSTSPTTRSRVRRRQHRPARRSRPRTKGMERKELLEVNGGIFAHRARR